MKRNRVNVVFSSLWTGTTVPPVQRCSSGPVETRACFLKPIWTQWIRNTFTCRFKTRSLVFLYISDDLKAFLKSWCLVSDSACSSVWVQQEQEPEGVLVRSGPVLCVVRLSEQVRGASPAESADGLPWPPDVFYRLSAARLKTTAKLQSGCPSLRSPTTKWFLTEWWRIRAERWVFNSPPTPRRSQSSCFSSFPSFSRWNSSSGPTWPWSRVFSPTSPVTSPPLLLSFVELDLHLVTHNAPASCLTRSLQTVSSFKLMMDVFSAVKSFTSCLTGKCYTLIRRNTNK